MTELMDFATSLILLVAALVAIAWVVMTADK